MPALQQRVHHLAPSDVAALSDLRQDDEDTETGHEAEAREGEVMNENMMAAVYAMTLRNLDNDKLAAFNNAIQTWGRLRSGNMAFTEAVELQLIKPNGHPHDLEALQKASAYEVTRRDKAGLFTQPAPKPEEK